MARPDTQRRIDLLISIIDDLANELLNNADQLNLSVRNLQDVRADLEELKEDRLP